MPPTPSPSLPQGGPPPAPVTITRQSVFGEIIESSAPQPEPGAPGVEGAGWDWLGTAASVAVPVLALAGVAVAVFAAKTYDAGADGVLMPASGEDRPAVVVSAAEFDQAVAAAREQAAESAPPLAE